MRISATEYPLLHEVANGATWVGTDEFPSCSEWADEHETWLRFVREARALPHYLPRLRGPKTHTTRRRLLAIVWPKGAA